MCITRITYLFLVFLLTIINIFDIINSYETSYPICESELFSYHFSPKRLELPVLSGSSNLLFLYNISLAIILFDFSIFML